MTRFGRLKLRRQVLYHKEEEKHYMPGNEVLPSHQGIIVTRGVQEWACLLPGEVPFATASRLLGWESNEEQLLSSTMIRSLVRQHGYLIRQAEQAEVATLWQRDNLLELEPIWVSNQPARLRASWPPELDEAVEQALAAAEPPVPEGVSRADWERVLACHRQDETTPIEQLRCLGPQVAEDELLVTTDEVLTRKPEKRCFWELRTAKVVTTAGHRYLSGVGEGFLQQLFLFLLLAGLSRHRSLVLIADGARWIRNFFHDWLAEGSRVHMILDWFHLHKKVTQMASMICRGKLAKTPFLATLLPLLWQGQVDQAVAFLQAYPPQAKNLDKLEELISYLQARQSFIPNYRHRRAHSQYIGSAHAEKANDLIVARRQKKKGMHWSLDTSDSLAALKTLLLNGGWDAYWLHGHVLPLVHPS